MPKPYEFGSEDVLIRRLRDPEIIEKATKFFGKRIAGIDEIVRIGVASNTFRAFRNLPVRPSVTFRTWATEYLTNHFEDLIATSNEKRHAQFVHDATDDLCRSWQTATGAEIGYGRGAKLINLVLKEFACLASLSEEQRTTLIELQHIPLDSYTLVGIRSIVPRLCIPKNATMKFVEKPAQYDEFQAVIRQIAKKAEVPPIYYDVLAWNMGHP